MPLIFSSAGCRRRIISEALIFVIRQRLQINLNAAGIGGGVGAVNSYERGKAGDSGVLENHVSQLLLLDGHCGK